jgi:hypothetical protein
MDTSRAKRTHFLKEAAAEAGFENTSAYVVAEFEALPADQRSLQTLADTLEVSRGTIYYYLQVAGYKRVKTQALVKVDSSDPG